MHNRNMEAEEDYIEIMKGKGDDIAMAGVLTKMREEAFAQGIEQGIERGREEGMEKGREEGREEGMERGREEEKFSLARKLKSMGFSLEDIVKLTGLSQNKLHML